MPNRSSVKFKLLYLIDILKKCTDENNPLNANELCDMLDEKGISSERKSIYNDIEVLKQHGYDIEKTKTPKAGYYLASREFEVPEIRLLMDAVQSATFISKKKTRIIIKKLGTLASDPQAQKLRNQAYVDYSAKCDNEELFYSIDAIHQAIQDKKKITLEYRRRVLNKNNKITTNKREFTLSPYALAWVNDHYYMIGNNEKYDNLMHLRVDRIHRVEVTKIPYRHFSLVSEYSEKFDTADYTSKLFNMFGGEIQQIELRCGNGILEQVLDRFGDRIFIRNGGEDHFSFGTHAQVSEGLVGWLLQFGDAIEVLSPLSLRHQLYKKAATLEKIYSK